MRTARAIFQNGDTITTLINGTDQDIINYYVGRLFNLGTVGDKMVRCVNVAILPEDENDYFYFPFSLERRELRKQWNRSESRQCWEEYLKEKELEAQEKIARAGVARVKAEMGW